MIKTNRKLRNFLIFPKIQVRLVFAAIIATSLSIGGVLYTVHAAFLNLKDIGQKLNFPENSGYFKLINAQQEIIFSDVVLISVASLLITVLILIVVSHRALGPIYRIKTFFQNYKKDSPEKIQFRDSDYFKQLEEDINRALK